MATIDQLQKELEGLVQEVPAFSAACFSVFSLEDLETRTELQTLPIAGVGYDGAELAGTNGTSAQERNNSVSMVDVQFLIILAISYRYAGQDDTKPQATNLLDQIRSKVLGYKGVNSRPWRFYGERPEPGASTDGMAFYSQIWRTTIPVLGDYSNP